MSSLKDSKVLITGASSGIGAGTAQHFARLGARLCLVARNQKRLEDVANKCRDSGSPEVMVIAVDLAVQDNCVEAVKQCIVRFGGLDVLISSAGILVNGSILDLSVQEYDRCININTRAAFIMTKECMPHLVKSKGNVVLVSSVCGLRSFPGALTYNLSVSGLNEVVRTISLEVAPLGVRINSVNPGVTRRTGVYATAGIPNADQFIEDHGQKHPVRRPADLSEITEGIEYLARASFVTGHHLSIDGGLKNGDA